MKKTIIGALLLIFGFGVVNISFADNLTDYNKGAIIAGNALNKTEKGKKYKKAIDAFVETFKADKAILNKYWGKIENLDSSKLKDQTLKNTLEYLRAKINTNLLSLSPNLTEINNKNGDEANITGQIVYGRDITNDLKVTFKVKDAKSEYGGYIEKYIWKIGTTSATTTKTGDPYPELAEKSSEFIHTFTEYKDYLVSVELVDSAGESKTITQNIKLPKPLN